MSAFLSLEDMLAFKKADARQMHSQIVNTHKMQIIGELDEANPIGPGRNSGRIHRRGRARAFEQADELVI